MHPSYGIVVPGISHFHSLAYVRAHSPLVASLPIFSKHTLCRAPSPLAWPPAKHRGWGGRGGEGVLIFGACFDQWTVHRKHPFRDEARRRFVFLTRKSSNLWVLSRFLFHRFRSWCSVPVSRFFCIWPGGAGGKRSKGRATTGGVYSQKKIT